MIKRGIILGLIVVLLTVCAARPEFLAAIVSLIIFGSVPGTSLIIPAWFLLGLYPLIILVGLLWLSRQHFFIGETTKPEKTVRKKVTKKSTAKTAAPRRRYRKTITTEA